MRHNLTVRVPQEAESSYSLFAQGLKIAPPKKDDDGRFLEFKFLGGTAVALFYTFAEFRRAYIVTEWESEADGERVFLPGTDAPLCLVFKAKGRKIDDMKRALCWLVECYEHEAFSLPLLFWQRLSVLIQGGKVKKSGILLLVKKCLEEKNERDERAS